MSGNQSEDCLNYQLIMDGFYYDAEIEHISEIIKNNLYFAVLEGDDNKLIKNTHDTFYFTVDDELIYINYYFDFGPLNISCVYKYCIKLNKLLQYAQGLKRIVHYTSANPIKRVNAAFLMGCYGIIYLNMEAKSIYKILLATGGPFKLYIDASQGVSQYTIRLLDCLQALQKALNCNFFNFEDFNVNEYDLHDKLQNGDMNWLVPRKFLAFIGPTDGEGVNGHSPEFYIKYFLENDIKMVIRLNNKVYDSTTFTQTGIQHHELFFPDGTVPTKQILLKFLDLAENSRSAIAVHCKAGLGRTGSLIGAYIIKHYHMNSREAIAWMRICRPGSVIGQQQGWLEKIESWLWKQGSQFRFDHYGDADKIPHHKYGIYSLEWQKVKDKLGKQVQKPPTPQKFLRERPGMEGIPTKYIEASIKRVNKPRAESAYPISQSVDGLDDFPKNFNTPKMKKNINQKAVATVERDEHHVKVSKLGKVLKTPHTEESRKSSIPQKLEDVPRSKINSKSGSRQKEKLSDFVEDSKMHRISEYKPKRHIVPSHDYSEVDTRRKSEYASNFHDTKVPLLKSKRRNQSESRDENEEIKVNSSRIRRHFVENLEQTQGDRLNEIKARNTKLRDQHENSENLGKTKAVKSIRRTTPVPKADAYLSHKPIRG